MTYYAHSKPDLPASQWQLLVDHLNHTGDLAFKLGQDAGVSELARVAGRMHDIGKYSQAFQRRLEGSSQHVDHATAEALTARCWNQTLCGTCTSTRSRNWHRCIRRWK
jgi:CRISPR-associated endonuclease/helicase Cas3